MKLALRSARKSPSSSSVSALGLVLPTLWAHTSPGLPTQAAQMPSAIAFQTFAWGGLSSVQAADQLNFYLTESRRRKLTGVALKQESHFLKEG
jgi:hypothetical protein